MDCTIQPHGGFSALLSEIAEILEWERRMEDEKCFTEVFVEHFKAASVTGTTDSSRDSPMQAYRQIDRMPSNISLGEENKLEAKPSTVSQCGPDPQSVVLVRPSELSAAGECTGFKCACTVWGDSKAAGEQRLGDYGFEDDFNTIAAEWKVSINGYTQMKVVEKADPVLREAVENENEVVKVRPMEVVQAPGHVEVFQRQEREYPLIDKVRKIRPSRPFGLEPAIPYRQKQLDLWRAAMKTAYTSGKYHTDHLLDRAVERLKAEGISSNDFYHLYHSTRNLDFNMDERIDEIRSNNALQNRPSEDIINDVMMDVGYMTLAMLYMRLYMEHNPLPSGSFSEASAVDSVNTNSSEKKNSAVSVPLKEHVNFNLAESAENSQNILKSASTSAATTSDTEHQNVGGPSSLARQSLDNEPTDAPGGLQSPDLTAIPNIVESIMSNGDSPGKVSIPLPEVSTSSDSSSSVQALLKKCVVDADSQTSSLNTGSLKDQTRRKANLGNYEWISFDSASRDATQNPPDEDEMQERLNDEKLDRPTLELMHIVIENLILDAFMEGNVDDRDHLEECRAEGQSNQAVGIEDPGNQHASGDGQCGQAVGQDDEGTGGQPDYAEEGKGNNGGKCLSDTFEGEAKYNETHGVDGNRMKRSEGDLLSIAIEMALDSSQEGSKIYLRRGTRLSLPA